MVFINIVFLGIDRLERLKGIPLRLMALDEFLEENPQWLGKVVFPFIGISAGERGQDYRQTQHDVRVLINRLNEKYSHCGVNMFYFEERHDRDIRLAQRLSLFAASDILLMTATRQVYYLLFLFMVYHFYLLIQRRSQSLSNGIHFGEANARKFS